MHGRIKNQPMAILKDSPVKAREYALRLLSYRSRSEEEIYDRLNRKGFDKDDITRAIKSLRDVGLINDNELVYELLKIATEKKYLGKRGLKLFLLNRGIRKDLIEKALSELSEETEKETASRFIERKLYTLKNYSPDIIKKRLWGMLKRRGFSVEIIEETLSKRQFTID